MTSLAELGDQIYHSHCLDYTKGSGELLNLQNSNFQFLCQSVSELVTMIRCAWKDDNHLSWQFQCLFQWTTWQICEIWIWILKICLTFWHSINTVLTNIKGGWLSYNRFQVVKRGVKVHFHLFVQVQHPFLPDITMTNANQIWLRSEMYPPAGDRSPQRVDKKTKVLRRKGKRLSTKMGHTWKLLLTPED